MARTWQTIRVFVSSTFRDMQAERDHLVKVVFPALRERLERHRIYLVDIDLRWGVTVEQADNDQTLGLCLEQIDKCDFFIGILGERYGLVPERLPDDTINRYSWIKEYFGKSITELEILHAALNEHPVAYQSFFYFRDPQLIESVPEAFRELFIDSPTKWEKLRDLKKRIRDAQISLMESYSCSFTGLRIPWGLAKLHEETKKWSESDLVLLHDSAKDSIIEPTEYNSLSAQPHLQEFVTKYGIIALNGLEVFGDRVFNDLWNEICNHPNFKWLREAEQARQEGRKTKIIIDSELAEIDFGAEITPEDELEYHQRFIESRLRVYVDREEVERKILNYVKGNSTYPLLVIGKSGSGKSAILAKTYTILSQGLSGALVLPHFVGASPQSTNLRNLLKRFCMELKRAFNYQEEIPEEIAKLSATFRHFVEKIPQDQQVIFFIDALNQLDETERAHQLYWLPFNLPVHVKFVLSCIKVTTREGEETIFDDVFEQQKHLRLDLDEFPLSKDNRKEIIKRVPSLSAKALDDKEIDLLLENSATSNPLYLLVALEELRGFGSFDLLKYRIEFFKRASAPIKLFGQVIEWLTYDFDKDIVKRVLSMIAVSRYGLTEAELQDLVAMSNPPLNEKEKLRRRREVSMVLRQIRAYLLKRGDIINFYHSSLLEAVRERYLTLPQTQHDAHVRLADYFENLAPETRTIEEDAVLEARVLDEFPWQLQQAGEWRRLKDCVSDIWIFGGLYSRDEYELLEYWLAIGDRFDLIAAYKASLSALIAQKPDKGFLAYALNAIAEFFRTVGHWFEAEPIYRQALSIREEFFGPEHPNVAQSLYNLAELLNRKGNHAEAASLYRRARPIWEKAHGPEHRKIANVANTIDGLAVALHRLGDYKTAKSHYDEALQIRMKMFGRKHPHVAFSFNNLGVYLIEIGDYKEAELTLGQALEIWKTTLGPKRPEVAIALHHLANIKHRQGNLVEAERLCRQAMAIREETLGTKHPEFAQSLISLADIMRDKGDYSEAERLYSTSLAISEKVLAPKSSELAETLNSFSELLHVIGKYPEAEKLCRQALAIREKAFGTESAYFAQSLNNLAELRKNQGDYLEAETLHRQALAIREKVLGPEHHQLAQSFNNLATVLHLKKDYKTAEAFYRRALVIYEKIPKSLNKGIADTLSNLGVLLRIKGNYAEAEILQRRALVLREEILGPEHLDIASSLNNLAMLLKAKGDYSGAESLYQRALVILESKLGPEHPYVITTRNNLAVLQTQRRNWL